MLDHVQWGDAQKRIPKNRLGAGTPTPKPAFRYRFRNTIKCASPAHIRQSTKAHGFIESAAPGLCLH